MKDVVIVSPIRTAIGAYGKTLKDVSAVLDPAIMGYSASGACILVTLLHAMAKRDAKKGLATLCIGGGQGTTLIVERE